MHLQVTIQKYVNGNWVSVSVPLPPGSSLTPQQVASIIGSDPGPYRLLYNATNPYVSTLNTVPLTGE